MGGNGACHVELLRPRLGRLCWPLAALLGVLAAGPARGERLALLVGVRKYDSPELTSLPYAENDVTVLAGVLSRAGYTRVVLLTGARPPRARATAANIRRELRALLKASQDNDTVVVAFAGHGVEFARSDEPYFCPADAQLANRATLISLSEVYRELAGCKAAARLLLSDACRNDPLALRSRGTLGAAVFAAQAQARRTPPRNVVALFSCSPGEYALETAHLKHGVFFHHVIEGLQGKAALPGSGAVTLVSLTGHAQRGVEEYVRKHVSRDTKQHPELVGRVSGTMVLVPPPADEVYPLLRAGQHRRAAELLTARLKAGPKADVLALRAEALAGQGDLERALADARGAVALGSRLARAHFVLGLVLARRKDHPGAIHAYNEAIRLDPGYASAWNNRGNSHAHKGDHTRAVADYTQALKLDPYYGLALRNRGWTHAQAGKPELGITDLTEALRLLPRDASIYHDRAELYARQRKDEKALDDLNEAIRLGPRQVESYRLRATVLDRLGRPKEAAQDRARARELSGAN
jgi:Tfp pilus assembly protein PilF